MNAALDHLPASIARCVVDGILNLNGETLELTEAGARLLAEEAGWAWGDDGQGDDCFVLRGSPTRFCYSALTWRDLVGVAGIAPLTRPVSGVLAG